MYFGQIGERESILPEKEPSYCLDCTWQHKIQSNNFMFNVLYISNDIFLN